MDRYEYTLTGSMTQFMYKVYGWMAGALALTATTAYVVASTPSLVKAIFGNPILLFGLFIGQFALVGMLSARLARMNYSTAAGMFLGYSVLNGITLSSIFLIYALPSIAAAFAITAGMFGVMAIYGYTTRSDLSSAGNLAYMALIGLLIATLINFFLASPMMEYILSLLGVAVFTTLTAYDMQKIKHLAYVMLGQGETAPKVALLGALTLYLDFINLFLFVIRLMGRQRRD